jgi:3-keto-5-aminohexanoate cleavage enzyme
MPAPVVIQCAITGSIATKEHGNVPMTVEENARAAVEAWEAGAAVIHIHAREEDGTPTQRVDRFVAVVDAIRATDCDAILNLSTGSAGNRAFGAERYELLSLKPEMASFDCGSTNFNDWVFENPLPFLREMAAAMNEAGTRPEIECFEPGHIVTAQQLRDEGLLQEPLIYQLVLGVRGASPASLEHAMYMRSLLPPDAIWSIAALGRWQLPLSTLCLIAGGNVRVGLEDNLFYRRGEPATNAQLVSRIVRLARELDLEVATPDQARELLAISAHRSA